MTRKVHILWFLIVMTVGLVACQSDSGNTNNNNTQNDTQQDSSQNQGEAPAESGTLEARRASINDVNLQEPRLLLWIGPGEEAGDHSAQEPGQIVLMDQDGTSETLMDVPQGTSRVYACTESATSPDARYFAFFIGGLESGTLYVMDGAEDPVQVAEMSAMACMGMGTFQFAPDSSRFGYLDFEPGAVQSDFPQGMLHIVEADGLQEQNAFESVSGFDFGDGFVTFVSLFTDNQGNATEAAVNVWVTQNPDEISTLFASNGCEFHTGQVSVIDENRVVVLMSESCSSGSPRWSLYTVNIEMNVATLMLTGNAVSSYAWNARASTLQTSPDGAAAFFTYPDRLSISSVDLQATLIDDPQEGNILLNSGVMPRFETVIPQIYDRDANASPVLSNNGRWMAIVSNDGNNNAAVNVIDLNAPELPPLTISAGSQGAIVSSMVFTPDNQRLLFVAGGHTGDNNSLFSVNLDSLTDSRILRGRYTREMVISPDSQFVALGEWIPNYLGLTVVNLENEQSGVLFAGVEFADDGQIASQDFVYPLSWRQ